MKRALAIGIAILVSAMLAGCAWIPPTESGGERVTDDPFFTADVVPPLTVAVDGRGSRDAVRWIWDWGDGKRTETNVGIARHTYERPGRYVIILTVQRYGAGGGGGGSEDLGPGPSGGANSPPPSGTPGFAATYRVVDLLQFDGPEPVILALSFWGNEPAISFFGGAQVNFYAGASRGRNLWYQWEVVYVDAAGNPTYYPWRDPRLVDGPSATREIEWMRSERETFSVRLPGPGGCPRHPRYFRFRVRLWATDEYGRRAMAETFVYTVN